MNILRHFWGRLNVCLHIGTMPPCQTTAYLFEHFLLQLKLHMSNLCLFHSLLRFQIPLLSLTHRTATFHEHNVLLPHIYSVYPKMRSKECVFYPKRCIKKNKYNKEEQQKIQQKKHKKKNALENKNKKPQAGAPLLPYSLVKDDT